MSMFTDLYTKINTLGDRWETANEKATNVVMDAIIANPLVRTAYEGLMLNTSSTQAKRARAYGAQSSIVEGTIGNGLSQAVTDLFMGVIGLTDIAMMTTDAVIEAARSNSSSAKLAELYEEALTVPNIEGIPILSPTLNTDREIDVGSQMMIVQEKQTKKQYWTDNAVPKLKEWQLDGYITLSIPPIDALYLIKPTLKIQADFLDRCATSRRPVLFKDNRGAFQLVQITSLKTTEEASYNNGIKVSIGLREYKPYTVKSNSVMIEMATQTKAV